MATKTKYLSTLTKAEAAQRLLELGEVAPAEWSAVEVKSRVKELEASDEKDVHLKGLSSKKRADLRKMCDDLKVEWRTRPGQY